MFLFFIPGLIFAVWFSLAAFVFVNEDTQGMSALLKSKEYMRSQWFAVFWRWLALLLIAWLISIPVGIMVPIALFIVKSITGAVLGPTIGQYAGTIISLIFLIPIQALAVSFSVIYGSLIYGNLRASRVAFDFAPSNGQKMGFMAIGIFGILSPLFMFGFAIKNMITSFDMTKGYKSDFKYNESINLNVNSGRNINAGGNKNVNSSPSNDSDKDGLSDSIEKSLGTNLNIADTDFDGLSVGDEVNTWKTKPTNPDTDGDGFRDGDEAKSGYNHLGNGKTENN